MEATMLEGRELQLVNRIERLREERMTLTLELGERTAQLDRLKETIAELWHHLLNHKLTLPTPTHTDQCPRCDGLTITERVLCGAMWLDQSRCVSCGWHDRGRTR
jgi:hypothetical protein